MSNLHGRTELSDTTTTRKLLPPKKLLWLMGGGLILIVWVALVIYMVPGLRNPLGKDALLGTQLTPTFIICVLLILILIALIYQIMLMHYPDMRIDQTERDEQREERRQRREGTDRREAEDRRTPKSGT